MGNKDENNIEKKRKQKINDMDKHKIVYSNFYNLSDKFGTIHDKPLNHRKQG